MIIDYLLIIAGILFTLEVTGFLWGLYKSQKLRRNEGFEPFVSIIVAARNEEENITPCLESLALLDYQKDKIEIVIVNDQSQDKTEEIIRDFIEYKQHFKLVNAQPGKGNLKGKANALSQGIEVSNGEIILFTDADCIVPKTWVKETVSLFTDNVGIVGGFTLLQAKNTFEGIQSLDWLYVFGVACATSSLGIPLTGVGNNLAVRRSLYNKVGGYNQIHFSVTEDYALTRSILTKTGYKMAFPFSRNSLVISSPCFTFIDLYRQKIRWGVGGLDMITAGFVIFGVVFVFNILLIVGLILKMGFLLVLAVLLKIFIDFSFISYLLIKMNKYSYIRYFIAFEIYFFIYPILLPSLAYFTKNVKWKDRKL